VVHVDVPTRIELRGGTFLWRIVVLCGCFVDMGIELGFAAQFFYGLNHGVKSLDNFVE